MMEKELVDLGLITLKQIRQQTEDAPAFKQYFMHGVGHPIGLDVHDVGITTKPIEAGWVMTVEPGIYIREEGFAVRLENNVLVTEKGPVDLMARIPIEADEIEGLMQQRSGNGRGRLAELKPARNGRDGRKPRGAPIRQVALRV